MKTKYYVFGVFLLIFPIVMYVVSGCKALTSEEKEYRAVADKYEGWRAIDIQKAEEKQKTRMSDGAYQKFEEHVEWMADFEHALCTYYLPEIKGEKGYVSVFASEKLTGGEGIKQKVAIPLMVYQEGYRYLFGIQNPVRHYVAAFTMLYFVLLFLYSRRKWALWKQFLFAAAVVVLVTAPELVWCAWHFGLRGGGYSVRSVEDMGGGTLSGVIRTMFMLRVLGVVMLESIYLFVNKFLYDNHKKSMMIVGCVMLISLITAAADERIIIVGSLTNLMVASNAFQVSYQYVGILSLLAVVIIAFCRFFPLYHYSEEDIQRINHHFG